MRRRYYDSRDFPFLSGLLIDQLLNFDWETSRKEIEEEEKKIRECKEKCCNYLQTKEPLNTDLKVYTPEFKLEDGVYTYVTSIGKNVKPEDIKIDASDGSFLLSYSSKSDTGSMSATSLETLPKDLDVETMKAVLKNGVITITAKQAVKDEEPEKEDDDETVYELTIEK
jgi:hypothetical protein